MSDNPQSRLSKRIILKGQNGAHKIFEIRDNQMLAMSRAKKVNHDSMKIEGLGLDEAIKAGKFCDFFSELSHFILRFRNHD